MQPITISKYGTGRCMLRGVEAEGVEADFGPGLKGFFSKAEFWRLLKARGEKENERTQARQELNTAG